MKKFWKIVVSVLFAACLIGALVACGTEKEPDIPDDGKTEYTVTVKSLGGGSIRNVTVNIFDGVDRVANEVTDAEGKITVRLDAKEYVVRLADIPVGYSNTEAKRTDTKGTPVEFLLESSVITDQTIPAGKIYQEGDVMYDFTVTTSTGTKFTLSEVLAEKKLVMINLWATWCGPCASEFPAMIEAYNSMYQPDPNEEATPYKDDVAIIALSISDANSAVESYKQQNGYTNTFDWGYDSAGISSRFVYGGGIPTSIFIDRYGVFSGLHTGALQNKADFTKYFDHYISDDYRQKDPGNIDPDPDTPPRPLPTYEPQASSVIEAAVNGEGFNGTYHEELEASDKEYSWPWLTKTEDGKTFIYNSNQGVQQYSFATIYVKYHAKKGDILTFDYNMDTESGYDYLYVIMPDSQIYSLSGATDGWQTFFAYAANEEDDYEIAFLYNTDETNDTSIPIADVVKLTNFRLCTAKDVENAGETLTIRYNCATGADTVNNTWKNYVEVAYNEQDGYYHLLDESGEPNGPYVLAGMASGTHWSDQSLYAYATGNNFDFGAGKNVNDLIIQYSYYAAVSDYTGYVPVTKELHDALVLIVENLGGGENHVTHENEWLEMCSYYLYYGIGKESNPITGVAPFSATALKETGNATANADLNEITITKNIVPRGFYYTFTPSETAVYEFKTYGDAEPVCWISSADDPTVWLNDNLEDDGNFTIYVPLQKGKLYYVQLDMAFQDSFGTYYLGIKNVGESARKFAPVTAGFYTTKTEDEITSGTPNVKIVMYADAWGLNADDEPMIYDKDGFEISQIYVNLLGPTPLTDSIALASIFDPPVKDGKVQYFKTYIYDELGQPVDRDGDGVYDTQEIIFEGDELVFLREKIAEAKANTGELYGYAVVDAQLMDILIRFTNMISDMRSNGMNVEDEWLMLCSCYYEYKI